MEQICKNKQTFNIKNETKGVMGRGRMIKGSVGLGVHDQYILDICMKSPYKTI